VLTPFGRQLVMIVAVLVLAGLLYLFFVSSVGRAATARGRDFACQEAGVCIEVHRP